MTKTIWSGTLRFYHAAGSYPYSAHLRLVSYVRDYPAERDPGDSGDFMLLERRWTDAMGNDAWRAVKRPEMWQRAVAEAFKTR